MKTFDTISLLRGRAIRWMTLAAALFVSVAATHETLFAIERAAAPAHCTLPHRPEAPAPDRQPDHACALCELAGAPTLLTLDVELPHPQAQPESENWESFLTPAVRDESCFPHLRRAPPSLPIA